MITNIFMVFLILTQVLSHASLIVVVYSRNIKTKIQVSKKVKDPEDLEKFSEQKSPNNSEESSSSLVLKPLKPKTHLEESSEQKSLDDFEKFSGRSPFECLKLVNPEDSSRRVLWAIPLFQKVFEKVLFERYSSRHLISENTFRPSALIHSLFCNIPKF